MRNVFWRDANADEWTSKPLGLALVDVMDRCKRLMLLRAKLRWNDDDDDDGGSIRENDDLS